MSEDKVDIAQMEPEGGEYMILISKEDFKNMKRLIVKLRDRIKELEGPEA